MKKITLEVLLKGRQELSYQEQYQYICSLIDTGKIKYIKNAPKNGKKPTLPLYYKIVNEEKDYGSYIRELQYNISTQISTDYYLKHLDIYEKERVWVHNLSSYLENSKKPENIHDNREAISLNERSFQIWNREKFLQKEEGSRILKHCGISIDQLLIYRTSEPLSYYSYNRETPQTILIIENKDTFYSIRKYLIETGLPVLGIPIRTLVYGAGKGILRSIEDFEFCVEPYMNNQDNRYLYFGDLDYEGVGIYEHLAKLFQDSHIITPFIEGYEKMLLKSEDCLTLPDTKEGQNRNLSGHFEAFFKKESVNRMRKILESGKYIPQEILNISDLKNV